MLANARVLGHVFNPITVFWCHRPDGTLACVVAEVHNTYGERHCYLLDPGDQVSVAKEFYVSPFLEVSGKYVMRLPLPGDRLALTIKLVQDGRIPLVATLHGIRTPAGTAAIVRAVITRPLVTRMVSLLIRRHGIALWLRRVPIVARPKHIPQDGVQ